MFNFFASYNTDTSKYSPSFLMSSFTYLLISLNLPNEMQDLMTSILKAFSAKICLLPVAMQRKYMQDYVNDKPETEYLKRNTTTNPQSIVFMSGMGQGMLFAFANLLVLAKCRLVADVVNSALMEIHGNQLIRTYRFNMTAMAASDDVTMLAMTSAKRMKDAFFILKVFILVNTFISRLCNLHINMAKSALTTLFTEFNSGFSRNKRPLTLVSKYIRATFMALDFSTPYNLVKAIYSGCLESFKRGCPINNIELTMYVANKWINCIYNTKDIIPELCEILDTKEDMLPPHLGFLPYRNVLVGMLYGPESTMLHNASQKMYDFLRGVYSPMMNMDEDEDRSMYKLQVYEKRPKRKREIYEMRNAYNLDAKKSLKVDEKNCMNKSSYTSPKETVSRFNAFGKQGDLVNKQSSLLKALSFSNNKACIMGYTKKEFQETMAKYSNEEFANDDRLLDYAYLDMKNFAICMMVIGEQRNSHLYENYDLKVNQLIEYMNFRLKNKSVMRRDKPYVFDTVGMALIDIHQSVGWDLVLRRFFLNQDDFSSNSMIYRLELVNKSMESLMDIEETENMDMAKIAQGELNKKVRFVKKILKDTSTKEFTTNMVDKLPNEIFDKVLSIYCQRNDFWIMYQPRNKMKEDLDISLINILSLFQDNKKCMEKVKKYWDENEKEFIPNNEFMDNIKTCIYYWACSKMDLMNQLQRRKFYTRLLYTSERKFMGRKESAYFNHSSLLLVLETNDLSFPKIDMILVTTEQDFSDGDLVFRMALRVKKRADFLDYHFVNEGKYSSMGVKYEMVNMFRAKMVRITKYENMEMCLQVNFMKYQFHFKMCTIEYQLDLDKLHYIDKYMKDNLMEFMNMRMNVGDSLDFLISLGYFHGTELDNRALIKDYLHSNKEYIVENEINIEDFDLGGVDEEEGDDDEEQLEDQPLFMLDFSIDTEMVDINYQLLSVLKKNFEVSNRLNKAQLGNLNKNCIRSMLPFLKTLAYFMLGRDPKSEMREVQLFSLLYIGRMFNRDDMVEELMDIDITNFLRTDV